MRTSFFKKNIPTILAGILSVMCILCAHTFTRVADADTVNVDLNVEGCNNNYICEAVIGEDLASCPLDCTPVATTTPPVVDEDDDNSGNSGDKIDNEDASFLIMIESIETTQSTIKIVWRTIMPTNGSLTWSTGSGYNLGSLQEVGFTTTHTTVLNNLLGGTTYAVALTATDLEGKSVAKNLNATTQSAIIVSQPVTNLVATESGEALLLTWNNPADDFEYIRIVKSDSFFPSTPYDGEVVYEGGAQSFRDAEIVDGVRYYYSVFVKGENGFSPGVLQSFMRREEGDLFGDVGEPVTIFGPIYDSTVVTDIDSSTIGQLFRIYQDGVEVSRSNNNFYVKNGRDVVFTVDKSNEIPQGSQVFVSYYRDSRMSDGHRYVLEYNEEKRKFITNFTVMNSERSVPFILYIRNNQKITGYVGYLNTDSSLVTSSEQKGASFWLSNDFIVSLFLFLLLVIFTSVIWYFFLFRKKQKRLED